MPKKILVTGANGQLGQEIRFLAPEFREFEFLFTDVAELDIAQVDEVNSYFANHKPDYLINCAAYTAVDRAETDISFAHQINVDAVKLLAAACKTHDCKFIHISTDYVFDGHSWTPYREDHPRNPQSVYGVSKLNGELAIENSGARFMIFRTSWLYSTFGQNFYKTMLRLGAERGQLGVVSDQTGTPTYAADLAQSLLEVVKQSIDNNLFPEGFYHYSNQGVCSWFDFAVEIMEMAGLTCQIKAIDTADYPLPAPRPPYSVLNKSKFMATFGLSIPHWRHSLERCHRRMMNS